MCAIAGGHAMTSRERVRRALTFRAPDRAPRDLWVQAAVQMWRRADLDGVLERYAGDFQRAPLRWGASRQARILTVESTPPGSDVDVATGVGVGAEEFRSHFAARCLTGTFRDEWGSDWRALEPGVTGEVTRPSICEWSDIAGYEPPYEILDGLDVTPSHEAYGRSDRFVIAHSAVQPFQRLMFMRRLDQLMLDIGLQEPHLERLLALIHEYNRRELSLLVKASADAIAFKDDWGTQTSLLISPQAWRRLFKPLYAEYCAIIHAAGKFAFFHSDGCIEAIYPDLIEVGIDAINSQLFTMNIEKLATLAKGRITLWGEIDRQHVLAHGRPQDARRAVQRVRRAFDDGQGGLIAQCVFGRDTPRAAVEAVFEAWLAPQV